MNSKEEGVALIRLWQIGESKRIALESGTQSMILLTAGSRTFAKRRLERVITGRTHHNGRATSSVKLAILVHVANRTCPSIITQLRLHPLTPLACPLDMATTIPLSLTQPPSQTTPHHRPPPAQNVFYGIPSNETSKNVSQHIEGDIQSTLAHPTAQGGGDDNYAWNVPPPHSDERTTCTLSFSLTPHIQSYPVPLLRLS